jgi:DNA recombination protein RmuC
MGAIGWAVAAILGVGLGLALGLLLRSSRGERGLEAVSQDFAAVHGEVLRLARSHEELRGDLRRGRDLSQHLSQAVEGMRGDLSRAHVSIAEVRALEEGRAKQLDQAASSLRRLEAVVAGSAARGAAGENILARSLSQLPPDLLETNVAFGAKVVEYALRLPGGKLLPIDSKWTSVASLERLAQTEDAQEQRKLVDQVARDVRTKIREMVKYVDEERTLSLAILAVPDAVYQVSPEAHADGYRDGILVVPYSLTLPYVLSLYRLALRFGSTVDHDQLEGHLRSLDEVLRRVEDEIEGRLSRGLVTVENARDALRDQVSEARRSSARLLNEAEGESPAPSVDLTLTSR